MSIFRRINIGNMYNYYRTSNAQIIGKREFQCNYISSVYNKRGNFLAVLSDGTIDHPNGCIAAEIAAEYCIKAFVDKNCADKGQFLYKTAIGASKHIRNEIYLGKTPRVSLTLLLFEGKTIHYFNVGANRIYIYDGVNELPLTNDSRSAFDLGEFNLFSKDTVAIFSRGLHVNLIDRERLNILNNETRIYDKAMAIVETVNKKNIVNQNNATALLVEVKV